MMALLGYFPLLVIAVSSLLVYSAVLRFTRWYKLRHIPGPTIAAWSKIWLLNGVVSGHLVKKLEKACNRYGSLVRVGPNWVACSDPAEIRRIWSVRSGYSRSDWYKASRLNPDEDNVLTVSGNKPHHLLRAHILPGYSSMENHEPVLDEQMLKLFALIEREYLSTTETLRPCNLARLMQYMTQDIITTVAFSETVGYLDVNHDIYGVLRASELVLLPAHIVSILPFLQNILALPIMKRFLPKPTDTHSIGRFLGVVKSYVDKRYEGEKIRNNDALQIFVDSGLSRTQVESEALVTLFGGTDTTSTGLRNTIFFLSTSPSAYRALQAEIAEAVKTANRPVIADEHAKRLPYLQACIKEGLRLFPPSMGLMGKVSDRDDIICGMKVPAGTNVGWAAMAVMRNKRVFGENAEVFEPRRWIDATPEVLRERELTYGLVFATGTRWECLGKRLAYIELGKVLFELFYRYDFAMSNPFEPFQWMNHGLTVQKNMFAKITARKGATLEWA